MIEFDVDMGYLLEESELDCVVLNDENGEHEPMEFVPKLGSGTCEPTEDGSCPYCGEDLVRCNVGIGEGGGAIELDPPIYHNYCPNCGRKVEA